MECQMLEYHCNRCSLLIEEKYTDHGHWFMWKGKRLDFCFANRCYDDYVKARDQIALAAARHEAEWHEIEQALMAEFWRKGKHLGRAQRHDEGAQREDRGTTPPA